MAKQVPGDVFQVISASDQLVFDRDKNVVGIRNRNGGDYFRFDQSDGAAKVGYQPEAGDATDVQTALRALDAGTTSALAASSGASLVGFVQSGAGAVARTAQDKGRETVSVLDFYANGVSGAAVDPTGVIDSTLGIQAAIDTAQRVYFPAGTYKLTAPLVQSQRNVLFGDGKATNITSSADDLFHIGVAAGAADGSSIRDMALTSAVGGGHIFVQQAQVVNWTFHNLYQSQQNAAKSIYSHIADAGNYINNTWQFGEWRHVAGATVPAFNFVVSSADGATNFNEWRDAEIVLGSKPWFYFESARASNYIYDVFLTNLLAEVTNQGIVKALGVNHIVIDNVLPFDLGGGAAVSADLFVFGRGTNASSQPSRSVQIRNYKRTDADATLNGYSDVVCLNAASGSSVDGLAFENCSRTVGSTSPLLFTLEDATNVTSINTSATLSGNYTNLTLVSPTEVSSTSISGGITATSLACTSAAVAIEATLNNYAIGAGVSMLICTPDAARNFSGIVAPSGAAVGINRTVYIYNASAANTLTLLNNSTSAAANQFNCPSATNFDIPPLSGVLVAYDAAVSRWIVLGK
jgi:hypothetical protein